MSTVRNWLIRTRSNHVLGPVSREKVIELIENGSISSDDEICSGNGYWVFVKEADLIQKYLFNGELQEFNYVSEALNEKKQRMVEERENKETTQTKFVSLNELNLQSPFEEGKGLEDEKQQNIEIIAEQEKALRKILKETENSFDSDATSVEYTLPKDGIGSDTKVQQTRELTSPSLELDFSELKKKPSLQKKSSFYKVLLVVLLLFLAGLLILGEKAFDLIISSSHAQDTYILGQKKK